MVDYMKNLNRCPANPLRSSACDVLSKQASTNKTCKIHRHCTVPAPMSGALHLFFPPVSPSPVSPCHVLYCPGPFHAARNSDPCSSTSNSKRTCLPPEQRSANTCIYIHPLTNIYIYIEWLHCCPDSLHNYSHLTGCIVTGTPETQSLMDVCVGKEARCLKRFAHAVRGQRCSEQIAIWYAFSTRPWWYVRPHCQQA